MKTAKKVKTQTQVSKKGVTPQVLVVDRNASGEKKKKQRNVVSAGSGDASLYKAALLNPFSDAALGARVPDQFFSPTATVSLREIISISNDTSGNADVVILPNAYNPAVSFRGSITNGATLITGDGTSFAKGGIINTASSLFNKLCNYRIVSWGLRIRNTTAVTSAQGVLTVALLPTHQRSRIPHNATVGGITAGGTGAGLMTAAEWMNSVGAPYTGTGAAARLDLSSLLDLPFHVRYQGTQLAEQTFEVHPKLIDGTGLSFRNSQDNQYGMDINPSTSAVYIQPGDASYLLMDGWTSVAIGFQGGSATAGSQTFDVELVYHLEGTPNVSSSSVFIVDAPVSKHEPLAAVVAQAALNSHPAFTKVAGAAMAAYRSFTGS